MSQCSKELPMPDRSSAPRLPTGSLTDAAKLFSCVCHVCLILSRSGPATAEIRVATNFSNPRSRQRCGEMWSRLSRDALRLTSESASLLSLPLSRIAIPIPTPRCASQRGLAGPSGPSPDASFRPKSLPPPLPPISPPISCTLRALKPGSVGAAAPARDGLCHPGVDAVQRLRRHQRHPRPPRSRLRRPVARCRDSLSGSV